MRQLFNAAIRSTFGRTPFELWKKSSQGTGLGRKQWLLTHEGVQWPLPEVQASGNEL